LKDKERRIKTNLTVSRILRFNLRLRGYSIWSGIFIAHHIKEDLKLLGVWAPHSLEAVKYSTKAFKTELQKKPKTTLEVLKMPAVLGYKELGGLVRPKATGLRT
jgi:hypothetical protein